MKNKIQALLLATIMALAMLTSGCGSDTTPQTEGVQVEDEVSEDVADATEDTQEEEQQEAQEETYIKFPEFQAVTINGDAIDSSIFAEADITMINIWGTFCGPCIKEMPDLAELYNELPEGCALIGIVTDVYGEENLDKAVEIVTQTGVTYDNIVPDDALYQFLAANISGVPTTLYVDIDGNILGGVVGARSKDEYKGILEQLITE